MEGLERVFTRLGHVTVLADNPALWLLGPGSFACFERMVGLSGQS